MQPQSVHSQSSSLTGCSNGKAHKKFTRYRMLHPTSTVDETLFGNNGSAECGGRPQCLDGSASCTTKTRPRRRSLSPKSTSSQPERAYVRLVTKDLIRDLLYVFLSHSLYLRDILVICHSIGSLTTILLVVPWYSPPTSLIAFEEPPKY